MLGPVAFMAVMLQLKPSLHVTHLCCECPAALLCFQRPVLMTETIHHLSSACWHSLVLHSTLQLLLLLCFQVPRARIALTCRLLLPRCFTRCLGHTLTQCMRTLALIHTAVHTVHTHTHRVHTCCVHTYCVQPYVHNISAIAHIHTISCYIYCSGGGLEYHCVEDVSRTS